jgi:hypothetical protein
LKRIPRKTVDALEAQRAQAADEIARLARPRGAGDRAAGRRSRHPARARGNGSPAQRRGQTVNDLKTRIANHESRVFNNERTGEFRG